ncbi:hypothetical protein PDIDSM_7626 [Penicillium digitatum]|nr:hypothetical protein PDIDSM_7626 [Penicillium digitatum]
MAPLALGLGIAVAKSFAIAIWTAIIAPFRGQKGGATAYKHIALSFTRALFRNASMEQIQLVLTPALAQKGYEAHVRQQKTSSNILILTEDTTAFWLGNPAAEKLIIYFPGGGYSLPALPTHFTHIEAFCTDIKNQGNSIGVLFLAYELSPKARWPRQLQQAVIVLRYAIEALGKRPSDIVLQGDSAGAHLALALLSHLTHPHPQDTVPRFSVDEPLRGTMLLSPWVDFRTDHASSMENADRDVGSAQTLNSWAQIFLGQTAEDEYNYPAKAPASWWRDVPVSRIFIGAGGDEVLLDPIRLTAEKMKAELPDATSNFTPYGTIYRDWWRLRRDLLAFIPSQKTLRIISEASSSWWLMRVQLLGDDDELLLSFSEGELRNRNPSMVGKTILWIALCLQQLPSEFDIASLDLPCLPWVLVEDCITRVSTLVCSDDSIASCIDGLECLVLQGLIFSNDRKLRSAWLSYRRAANIAQIIGFHRAEPAPNESAEYQHRATFIWRHILMVDRHFSLILDLPVHNEYVLNPLARKAGSIIERNQTFTEVTPAMLQMTQGIEAALQAFLQAFEPPPLASPDNVPPGNCPERSLCFLNLHYRLWYYLLMAWLHLPLSIIACYVNIRRTTENGFDSSILDFQAFTTAMTISVSSLGPFNPLDKTKEDYLAIDRVVAILGQLSKSVTPDRNTTRALHVLTLIRTIGMGTEPPPLDESEGHQHENGRLSRIKLDIPYIGTRYLEHRAILDPSKNIAATTTPLPTFPSTPPVQYFIFMDGHDPGPWLCKWASCGNGPMNGYQLEL